METGLSIRAYEFKANCITLDVGVEEASCNEQPIVQATRADLEVCLQGNRVLVHVETIVGCRGQHMEYHLARGLFYKPT